MTKINKFNFTNMCLLVQKEKLIQSVIEIEPRNQDRELDALPTTP
jgi:hypothetical protein